MWTRRKLLVRGTALAAAWPFAPHVALLAARAPRPDRILVVLQLTGGNDGLNTLIPIEQDAWFRSRPVLSQVGQGAHRISDEFALHPSLGRLARRFEQGSVSAVHSVGYAFPDRSHFYSMGVWHTGRVPSELGAARPDTDDAVGWLGRAAELLAGSDRPPPIGLHVGGGTPPFALHSPDVPPTSLADERELVYGQRGDVAQALADAQRESSSDARHDLAYLRRAAREANELSERLEQAATGSARAPWPDTELARKLRLVARWIDGGLGASIYSVELSGFDTHLEQAPTHRFLLSQLDGAVDAFLTELEATGLSQRVALLAFSEFGRRARENASAGTDHGAAGPVFLAGGALTGGLHGTPPDLEHIVDGDVPHTTDLRAVQATLERDWLGVEPASRTQRLPLFQRT